MKGFLSRLATEIDGVDGFNFRTLDGVPYPTLFVPDRKGSFGFFYLNQISHCSRNLVVTENFGVILFVVQVEVCKVQLFARIKN